MNKFQEITIIEKIKLHIMKLAGYRQGTKFINETKPYVHKYPPVEKMKIAKIEEKLSKALENNKKMGELLSGITEKECYDIIEWVIQRDREIFIKYFKFL